MPLYQFECKPCRVLGHVFVGMAQRDDPVKCILCGDPMARKYSVPNVTGTRDHFNGRKPFIHTDDTGHAREITSWREWERAGYRGVDGIRDQNLRAGAKRKLEKIQKYDTKKKFSVVMK